MANDETPGIGGDRALLALSAVVLAHLDARADAAGVRRSEFVLDEAGFTRPEISAVTGRNPEAVRSTLRRAKPAAQKDKPAPKKGS